MRSLQKKFEKFKTITKEEEKIIKLIKNKCKINKNTSILEIGSNKGNISRAIQRNSEKITLVDIEEFNVPAKIKFIKNRWEEVEISEKFDIIIASHVWGHFHYTKTSADSYNKMLSYLNKNGKLIICYNTNKNFMKKLIEIGKVIFSKDFQYDYFNEKTLKRVNYDEIRFKVRLKTDNFENLADIIQVLIIVQNEEFAKGKRELIRLLKKNLKKPEFIIEQKLIVIEHYD